MGKAEKVSVQELLRRLFQRSGAKCEGSKLGFDCNATLRNDGEAPIHHVDGNPRNNDMSNLVLLCPACHSKVLDQLAETRRKAYVQKVAEELDKRFFSN